MSGGAGGTASAGAAPGRASWAPGLVATLIVGLALAACLRLILLPSWGLPGDLDVFAAWANLLATDVPLGSIYEHDMSFGPVMAYVFWLVGHAHPVFTAVADGSDPLARALLKAAPAVADIAIACTVAWALRGRPRVAVASALAVAFVPVTWYASAFWGQYESIYTLLALLAAVFAIRGRWAAAGVMLGLALATKPQVLPLVVPLAAFTLARIGVRRSLVPAAAAAATLVVLWIPFVAAGGPLAYLRSVAAYQGEAYAVLSLRAWNPWWIVQEWLSGGQSLIADGTPILGPLTPRAIGYAATAVGLALVFVSVRRTATDRSLILGMAAASLVAYCLLTTMHERYAYPAVVFLALLLSERRILLAWIVLVAATTANYVAAAPPGGPLGSPITAHGPLGIAAALAIAGVTVCVVADLVSTAPARSGTARATDRLDAPQTGTPSAP